MLLWIVDFPAAWAALKAFDWPYLVLALLSLGAGYVFRILRWTVMLRATGADTTIGSSAAAFLGSIALNNVLPLRIGDVVRVLVFPAAIGISRSVAAASVLLERVIDLITLVICLAAGTAAVGIVALPAWLERGALVISICALAALIVIVLFSRKLAFFIKLRGARADRSGIVAKVIEASFDILTGLARMSRATTLVLVLVLSMLGWAGETGLYGFMLTGLGISGGAAVALVVMAVATLSTLVPSSPGYVGTFHLAALLAVDLLGGTQAQAASFALLVHLVLWGSTTVAGGIAMLVRPDLFRQVVPGFARSHS